MIPWLSLLLILEGCESAKNIVFGGFIQNQTKIQLISMGDWTFLLEEVNLSKTYYLLSMLNNEVYKLR